MKSLLVLSLGVILSAPVAARTFGPDEILAQIQKQGGHKVLWELWENDAEFGAVLSGIESANPKWLRVASLLRPYSDAAASETMDNAVALALPKAPGRILPLIGHGFDLDHVCTSPFFEPDPGVAEAYEKKTLAALAAVHGALKSLATECAQRVRLPSPGA